MILLRASDVPSAYMVEDCQSVLRFILTAD